MSNKRPLKSYIRYDGSGRAVSSSLIWRKNKPKVGNWKEVQGYECCDIAGCNVPPVPLSAIATGFPVDGPVCIPYIRFKCDDVIIWNITDIGLPTPPPAISLEEYISYVALIYSWVGTWSTDGTTVTLEMNGGVASALCPTGELTMIVGVTCPA